MEMVYYQDMTLELSAGLLAAQREIHSLRIRFQNTNATVRGYQRMVEGQASDLYAFDTSTHLTRTPGPPPPQSRVQTRSLT
jgi:hypothetical protein